MFVYAQLRAGVVVAVTRTHSEIDAPDMVQIADFDDTLIGAAYVGGEFIRPDPAPAS